MEEKPNPGSDAALELGCKCPVIDNHHGEGVKFSHSDEPNFWINSECPIHSLT